MPSVQILVAPINVSALQDIPVMVFHVQVRKRGIFYIFSLARRKRVHELHLDSLELVMFIVGRIIEFTSCFDL